MTIIIGSSRTKLGDSNTYIYVDTTNNKIQFYINGVLVQEWG